MGTRREATSLGMVLCAGEEDMEREEREASEAEKGDAAALRPLALKGTTRVLFRPYE